MSTNSEKIARAKAVIGDLIAESEATIVQKEAEIRGLESSLIGAKERLAFHRQVHDELRELRVPGAA